MVETSQEAIIRSFRGLCCFERTVISPAESMPRQKQRAPMIFAVEGRLGSPLVSLSVRQDVGDHSSKYTKMTLPQHGLIPMLSSHWLRVVVS